VSVKDRWFGLCEQVLTDVWVSPLLWLRVGEKLDGDPQIGQPACCGCSQEFLFLESSDSVQLCHSLAKGLLMFRMDLRKHTELSMYHIYIFPREDGSLPCLK
jgi:hypothetical protein